VTTVLTDLGSLLDEIKEESRKEKISKREASHRLANGFMDLLCSGGAKILEVGRGNSNYFCAEINGKSVAISPFGSHEEFWEKVSDGFRTLYAKRACRWGVVLFILPEKRGVWIEGNDYDSHVLHDKELLKVNSLEVKKAERSGIAHSFADCAEFINLISQGPIIRPKALLIKKKKERV